MSLSRSEIKCYCENRNGGFGNNTIICEDEGGIVNTTTCESDEGCTGPSKRDNGALYYPFLPMTANLCQKG